MYRSLMTSALAFGALTLVASQESVTLRIKERPGEVYHQTARFHMSMSIEDLPEEARGLMGAMLEGEQSVTGVFSIRTRVVDAKDGRITVRRAVHPISMTGQGLFGLVSNELQRTLTRITEEVIDPFGTVVRTRTISGDQAATPDEPAWGPILGEPGTGFRFPRHAVKPGDSWTTKDAEGREVRVRFFDWEQWNAVRAVRLEFAMDFLEEEGVQSVGPGVVLLDPATGRLLLMSMMFNVDQAGAKVHFRMHMEMDTPR